MRSKYTCFYLFNFPFAMGLLACRLPQHRKHFESIITHSFDFNKVRWSPPISFRSSAARRGWGKVFL
jgi:hypothetical protein